MTSDSDAHTNLIDEPYIPQIISIQYDEDVKNRVRGDNVGETMKTCSGCLFEVADSTDTGVRTVRILWLLYVFERALLFDGAICAIYVCIRLSRVPAARLSPYHMSRACHTSPVTTSIFSLYIFPNTFVDTTLGGLFHTTLHDTCIFLELNASAHTE
jgi:hypothetical protein